MNLQLPEITSKHYARQVIEAMLHYENEIIVLSTDKNGRHGKSSVDEVLDILFPEGE